MKIINEEPRPVGGVLLLKKPEYPVHSTGYSGFLI